jgi:hypothetical protein
MKGTWPSSTANHGSIYEKIKQVTGSASSLCEQNEIRSTLDEGKEIYEQRESLLRHKCDKPLAPTTIPRRAPEESDVQIEILFCGICHSDLHYVRDIFRLCLFFGE